MWMQLASEKERDALSDAVSQLLAKLKAKGKGKMGEENVPKPKKPKGASPVELAARKSLLHTNKCDQRPPLHVMGGSRPVHIRDCDLSRVLQANAVLHADHPPSRRQG